MSDTEKVPTYKKLAIRFKQYIIEANDIWESFEVINSYADIIHQAVKRDEISLPDIIPLTFDESEKRHISDKGTVYGTLSRIQKKINPRTALIESTLTFENYISEAAKMVYLDYPQKAISIGGGNENAEKLTNIILTSKNKNEMIDRILEEKLRGIFYGNIAEIFQKDRARLELRDAFKDEKGKALIENLIEITARRNILIHNGGKIDRKYIRETKNTSLKPGRKLTMDSAYIKNAINVYSEISAVFTKAILKNIYKVNPESQFLTREYWHE